MCAIAGIFSKSEGVDKQELERMCERMKLRGPDRGGALRGKAGRAGASPFIGY